MTKQQWTEDRKRISLPASSFFEYYKEHGGKVTTFDEFVAKLFTPFLTDDNEHLMNNATIVSRQGAENKVRNFYDQKFGIKD